MSASINMLREDIMCRWFPYLFDESIFLSIRELMSIQEMQTNVIGITFIPRFDWLTTWDL